MSHLSTLAMAAAIAAGAPIVAENSVPQVPGTVSPQRASTATVPDQPAAGDILTFANEESRMTVPVSIGASGPYRFIIDTGSERTVVSRELAGTLNLAAGRRVRVTSMTGQSELGTFLLPALQVSLVRPDTL